MHRIVGALALLLLLAGCGGTDWTAAQNGSAGSVTAPTVAKRAKTASAIAAQAAAERPYVDAMVAGAIAQDKGVPGVTAKAVRCVASALVHGFGADAFVSGGITPTALRDPNSSLDALPEPSDDQVTAIGTTIQHCAMGRLMAEAVAISLKVDDHATVTCLAQQLDSDPGARRFLVFSWVQRDPDLLATHGIVGAIAACVDLPSYVLNLAGVQLDPTTRACILDTLKNSEAQLKDLMALRMAGEQVTSQQYQEALAVSINQCRPSARTGFTVPSA